MMSMEDWGAVKARLEDEANGVSMLGTTQLAADIRAALELVEEQRGIAATRAETIKDLESRNAALRQRVEQGDDALAVLNHCAEAMTGLACEHGVTDGTPAMMWPEAILCAVKHAKALRQRVEELEREKYGTPCKCEQWVNACGEAEKRAEAAEAKLALLERDALSSAPPYYRKWEEAFKRAEAAEAEVARLEGLILDWWDGSEQPQVDGFVATVQLLEAEARRIRAQREEGLYHSHTCDLHPEDQCQACEEGR